MSHGLKTLPDVVLDRKPRMADFAVWVTACEGALWKKRTFMAAYTGNIQEAAETVLENDQVAAVLRTYMDETPQFAGTATELLEALNGVATEPQQKAKAGRSALPSWEDPAPDRPAAAQGRDRRLIPRAREPPEEDHHRSS